MTNTKEDAERVKFESVDRLPRDGYMGGDVYYVKLVCLKNIQRMNFTAG